MHNWQYALKAGRPTACSAASLEIKRLPKQAKFSNKSVPKILKIHSGAGGK